MEATQLTNETLTVEVAVKLPPSVKGEAITETFICDILGFNCLLLANP